MKIDWGKIDNDKTFQRLINHLFALECNSPDFIPSSPYIGADGAWDGFYEGPYENILGGVWSIQSKFTTKSFDAAYEHLQEEIKKELRKAQKNRVDHLRIATNAELRVKKHVIKLENLNSGEVKSLKIWHRERLTMRIEKQPFVRHLIFGAPQFPVLLPWDIYFKQYEKSLLDLIGVSIKFSDELDHIKSFILQDKLNMLIIHAPGGNGKSYLLREVARNAHSVDRERQCWLVRAGARSIIDAISDEVISGKKYLLILDDAERFIDEAKSLIAFAKSQGNVVKLILGTRTAGLNLIKYIFTELRCEELLEALRISKWEVKELIGLLRTVTGKKKVNDEELIVKTHPNPFILVWISKHMKGEKVDISKVREKIVNNLESDVEKALDFSVSRDTIKEFLLNLACSVPCQIEDIRTEEIFETYVGIEKRKLKTYVNKLLEVEVLREIGKSTRFNPDMIGDLYLAFKVDKLDETEINNLLKHWIEVYPENTLVNLASASRYGDFKYVVNFLRKLIRTWIQEIATTSYYVRRKNLSLASNIAYFVPEVAIDLIYSYLRIELLPEKTNTSKTFGIEVEADIFKPNLDDYGPVIVNLMNVPSLQKKIVSIISYLANSGLRGQYDNYKTRSLIRKLVSPIYRKAEPIIEVFDELSAWLKNSDIEITKGELMVEAISQILASSHEWSRVYLEKFEFGERILKDTPIIHKLRDLALNLLKELLLHTKLEMKLLGIKAIENIGRTRHLSTPLEGLPLAKRIVTDRKESLEILVKLIRSDAEFSLLNEIENLLITCWAQDIPGAEKASELLRNFPHSLEYIIFRYYVSPDYVIQDFKSIERDAPQEDKWKWYVYNFRHKSWKLKPDDLKPLTKRLNRKYKSPQEIVTFMEFLQSKISYYNPWARPPFFASWIQVNAKVFLSIRNDTALWEKVPDRFKREIEIAISKFDKKHINKVANEIFVRLPNVNQNKVQTFLQLLSPWSEDLNIGSWTFRVICLFPWISKFLYKYRVLSWLVILTKKGSSKIRNTVVSSLYYIFECSKDANTVLKLLNLVGKREKGFSPDMFDDIAFLLHWVKTWQIPKGSVLTDFQNTLLYSLRDVLKVDYKVEELLDFSCDNVDSMINFVEYRLNKSLQMRKNRENSQRFEAIPFNGIKTIENKISGYEDFKKLAEKIIDLYKDKFLLGHGIERLMGILSSPKCTDSGELFLVLYIEEQIDADNIKHALIASRFLSITDSTCPIFLKVLQNALDCGLTDEVKRIFASVIRLDEFSGEIGKPSPELVSQKVILKKMNKKVQPGLLKSLIEERIQRIETEIQEHLKSDKEYLNPRS